MQVAAVAMLRTIWQRGLAVPVESSVWISTKTKSSWRGRKLSSLVSNVVFCRANIAHRWPVRGESLVSVSSCLPISPILPMRLSKHTRHSDLGGWPSCRVSTETASSAIRRYLHFRRKGELFIAALCRRGGDPLIGRRLVELLEAAGFSDVHSSMVQPYGRNGDVKRVPMLTFVAIRDALMQLGLTSIQEVGSITAELGAFLHRSSTTVGLPRIFQAWGRRQ